MAGALIITAEMGEPERGFLDRLRKAHFPPERNQLPAHLTMFHALPPSAESEVRRALAEQAKGPPPRAMIAGILSLGRGTALRIVSEDLERIRGALAENFRGLMSAQDSQGWRLHVTIQNKVDEREARALKQQLEAGFEPRPLPIRGLGLHRYMDGPWEAVGLYPFRGRSA